MVIDAHHHLMLADDYLDRLISEAGRLSINKICLFSIGRNHRGHGIAGNDEVRKAMESYPDIIIGFACFNLGDDRPEMIDEFVQQGFKGIKFINPASNYDDKDYYPVYERMESHGIPGLFHLGIVARSESDRLHDINNDRHRPVYLDTIARAFPDLKIIGAHLGNPWCEEAAMAARWNPNLYFDLSGSILKKEPPQRIGELLWWTPQSRYRDPLGRHAWEKIVFGSDVPAEEIEDVLGDYRRTMAELNIPAGVREKVLGGTMAGILGLFE